MQTFLVSPSFAETAHCLDKKRLGKQRVEAKQILNALHGKSKGWVNHPATLMWYGYEDALSFYHDCMVAEWINRGYKNNMPFLYTRTDRSDAGTCQLRKLSLPHPEYPHWWRDENTLKKIIVSHQSNLKRKDPTYYNYEFLSDDLPYFWPVTKAEVEAKRVLALCP